MSHKRLSMFVGNTQWDATDILKYHTNSINFNAIDSTIYMEDR